MSIRNYVEIECDICGEGTGMCNNFEEVKEESKKQGYVSRKNGDDEWENLCPNCK